MIISYLLHPMKVDLFPIRICYKIDYIEYLQLSSFCLCIYFIPKKASGICIIVFSIRFDLLYDVTSS